MSKEIWKSIPNYSGYQVSNLGKIKSLDRFVPVTRHGKTFMRFYKGRIKKPKIDGLGYYFTDLWFFSKCKFLKISRLVLSVWTNIDYDSNKQTNHKDGNKANNNINNLEWVTASENSLHAVKNKLRIALKGSKHYKAKFLEKDIIIIRKKFKGNRGDYAKIASEYDVSYGTIYDIIKNNTWRSVKNGN